MQEEREDGDHVEHVEEVGHEVEHARRREEPEEVLGGEVDDADGVHRREWVRRRQRFVLRERADEDVDVEEDDHEHHEDERDPADVGDVDGLLELVDAAAVDDMEDAHPERRLLPRNQRRVFLVVVRHCGISLLLFLCFASLVWVRAFGLCISTAAGIACARKKTRPRVRSPGCSDWPPDPTLRSLFLRQYIGHRIV